MKTDAGLIKDRFRSDLSNLYARDEINHLWRILFEHITGSSSLGLNLKSFPISEEHEAAFEGVLNDLISGTPYQYVIGSVPFVNINLVVEPGVLIPRPETEELVELIKSELAKEAVSSILDLGTGSGCIALALANHYREATVTAVDVSAQALAITRKNALLNKIDIDIREFDILNGSSNELRGVDVMVSNPPYIAQREAQDMEARVLEHEPDIALFVPNEDPLLFYRKIGELADRILNPGGSIYFELNSKYAVETQQLLESTGWYSHLYNDLSGNKRFLKLWQ